MTKDEQKPDVLDEPMAKRKREECLSIGYAKEEVTYGDGKVEVLDESATA